MLNGCTFQVWTTEVLELSQAIASYLNNLNDKTWAIASDCENASKNDVFEQYHKYVCIYENVSLAYEIKFL